MRALSAEAWRLRGRTVLAMALLCRARLMIAFVPLWRWSRSLGLDAVPGAARSTPEQRGEARRLARHVVRGAARLPGETVCLPQAMALSAMLRRARLPHALVIAARPRSHAGAGERLHAWVEQAGERIIGDLPGPWIETLRLGEGAH
jgi:hypothetical protein